MKNIKYLTYVLSSALLNFGLIGCNSDKNQVSPNENWSVGELRYIQYSTHEDLSFNTASTELPYFSYADKLVFTKLKDKISKNERVAITTKCENEKITLSTHKISESLRKEYRIFEMLPPEAIVNEKIRDKSPLRCSFKIEVKSPREDIHSYTFEPTFVTSSHLEDYVSIKKSMLPIAQNETKAINLLKKNLEFYTLDPIAKAKHHYVLRCNSLSGSPKSGTSDIGLDQLLLEAETQSNKTSQSIEKCRIFLVEGKNRIVKMSVELNLREEMEAPLIEMFSSAKIVQTSEPIQQFQIFNPTELPMFFALNDGQDNPLIVTALWQRSPKELFGSVLEKPMKLKIVGAKADKKYQETRFTLEPGKHVILKVMTPFQSIFCDNRTTASFVIEYATPDGLTLFHLDSLDATLEDDSIYAKHILETQMPRYFNSDWSQVNGIIPEPKKMQTNACKFMK